MFLINVGMGHVNLILAFVHLIFRLTGAIKINTFVDLITSAIIIGVIALNSVQNC